MFTFLEVQTCVYALVYILFVVDIGPKLSFSYLRRVFFVSSKSLRSFPEVRRSIERRAVTLFKEERMSERINKGI